VAGDFLQRVPIGGFQPNRGHMTMQTHWPGFRSIGGRVLRPE
jgi:hypothetical protein